MSDRNANRAPRDGGSAPRVTRVTPEGLVIYDPLSIIKSGPFRKHIRDLVKNSPIQPRRTPRTSS